MTGPNVTGAHDLERIIEWCSDDPVWDARCSCGWSSDNCSTRSAAVLAWEDHRVARGIAAGADGYSNRV